MTYQTNDNITSLLEYLLQDYKGEIGINYTRFQKTLTDISEDLQSFLVVYSNFKNNQTRYMSSVETIEKSLTRIISNHELDVDDKRPLEFKIALDLWLFIHH